MFGENNARSTFPGDIPAVTSSLTKESAPSTTDGTNAVKPIEFMEPNESVPSIVVGLRPVETTPNGKRSVVPMYDGKNPAVPTLDGRESVATTSV
jgi:hypothetical protein